MHYLNQILKNGDTRKTDHKQHLWVQKSAHFIFLQLKLSPSSLAFFLVNHMFLFLNSHIKKMREGNLCL